MKVHKVREGAYFVQSYSEQTVITFQPNIAAQTISSKELEIEDVAEIGTEGEKVCTEEDVEEMGKRSRRKTRK